MACDMRIMNMQPGFLREAAERRRKEALAKLAQALKEKTARVVIGSNGAVAFQGWNERNGISDVCAYRALTAANSAELRAAVARAEAMSGRKLNPQAVGAGVHSHDGGNTWHAGH